MGSEIDEQIRALLGRAAECPMLQDPVNMVGSGSTLLAAKLFVLRQQQKLTRGETLDYGKVNGDDHD